MYASMVYEFHNPTGSPERGGKHGRHHLVALCRWLVLLVLVYTSVIPTEARREACTEGRLRVAVDVGHSKTVPGAKSATGKPEYDFNKRFAVELGVARGKAARSLDLFLLSDNLKLLGRPREAAQKRGRCCPFDPS